MHLVDGKRRAGAWQTVQASPSDVVFARKCDAAGMIHVAAGASRRDGWIGLIGPCGSVTGFKPDGQILLAAIDVAQRAVLVSVAAPVGLIAGNRSR